MSGVADPESGIADVLASASVIGAPFNDSAPLLPGCVSLGLASLYAPLSLRARANASAIAFADAAFAVALAHASGANATPRVALSFVAVNGAGASSSFAAASTVAI